MLLLAAVVQAQAPAFIDSVEQALEKSDNDSARISLLEILTWELRISESDRAEKYAYRGLKIAENADHKPGAASIHHALASLHYNKGNYALALDQNTKALVIRQQIGDKKAIAASLGNIGLIYKNRGDYPLALEYYFNAMKIKEELKDQRGLSISYGNLGIVYKELGKLASSQVGKNEQFQLALKYYDKSLELATESGNKRGIADNYVRIATINTLQKNFTISLEYYTQALELYKELEDKQRIGMTLGNMGITFEEQGDLPRAMEYYQEALILKREIGYKLGIALSLGNIGTLHLLDDNYGGAETYLKEALEIVEEIGYLAAIKEWNGNLSELYTNRGRFKLALEHYKEYTAAKDSLFNEEKSKELGKLEAKHEFETAEAERKRLAIEQLRLEKALVQRRNSLQYSGILIFLVMLGAGLIGLGRLSIPVRLAEGLIFFTFLLFFEFTLVLLDPFIEAYSSGAPAIKLGFNAALAALIFPLHAFFESKVKARIVK
ncbi:MAG: tetratricopeptide repeat protein [Flavobacteriales bacterium]|nr:tetratricopeptide repeat protein [Flavobacteriales bacterium]